MPSHFLAAPILPTIPKARDLLDRLDNLRWDWQLGIRTRGVVATTKPDANHYATMGYRFVGRIVDALSLRPDDVFVDVGSGRGRVLCCAARRTCRSVVGIEYAPDLCRDACRNAESLRGRRTPIAVHNGLAESFDYSRATVVFLFNPFGASTLDRVLEKLRADRDGQPVRLAFANPDGSQDGVFRRHSWLQPFDRWEKQIGGAEHGVAFHHSR
ncbi:class I SAM-dependent methyltransferase [Aureimonas sp. AU40]|uniref:class I SAM-dependent methyltransferase n=1 Tax=Aureimonas sp. AU40 TaxID=1637747 RepID=UPI000781E06D|nr:hypothetical protein [Aureimonas sp. AU40]